MNIEVPRIAIWLATSGGPSIVKTEVWRIRLTSVSFHIVTQFVDRPHTASARAGPPGNTPNTPAAITATAVDRPMRRAFSFEYR